MFAEAFLGDAQGQQTPSLPCDFLFLCHFRALFTIPAKRNHAYANETN